MNLLLIQTNDKSILKQLFNINIFKKTQNILTLILHSKKINKTIKLFKRKMIQHFILFTSNLTFILTLPQTFKITTNNDKLFLFNGPAILVQTENIIYTALVILTNLQIIMTQYYQDFLTNTQFIHTLKLEQFKNASPFLIQAELCLPSSYFYFSTSIPTIQFKDYTLLLVNYISNNQPVLNIEQKIILYNINHCYYLFVHQDYLKFVLPFLIPTVFNVLVMYKLSLYDIQNIKVVYQELDTKHEELNQENEIEILIDDDMLNIVDY